MSVTNNRSFQSCPHLDNYTRWSTDASGLYPFTMCGTWCSSQRKLTPESHKGRYRLWSHSSTFLNALSGYSWLWSQLPDSNVRISSGSSQSSNPKSSDPCDIFKMQLSCLPFINTIPLPECAEVTISLWWYLHQYLTFIH